MVFVDYPWIPMDNSEAERRMRIAALGRKNYYGSGSVWNGHFTACLFSIFQTLKLWNVNPRKWLTRYLQAQFAVPAKHSPLWELPLESTSYRCIIVKGVRRTS